MSARFNDSTAKTTFHRRRLAAIVFIVIGSLPMAYLVAASLGGLGLFIFPSFPLVAGLIAGHDQVKFGAAANGAINAWLLPGFVMTGREPDIGVLGIIGLFMLISVSIGAGVCYPLQIRRSTGPDE
jgi:hypothetical protein